MQECILDFVERGALASFPFEDAPVPKHTDHEQIYRDTYIQYCCQL